ncbi:GGDEF domain-containing protein [Candidatus Raskinella chloraquaticus]|jgi:EAL domain-containing protein (putative c-di-GMP-specific phosphodiesterase class I)/GGDEF domain-containing protein|uniref:Diguanylate phosphodiesterase n=3 Tax=Candidatus Raskinella chloraquaticus TaxID=1951219 RepID=A0A1W9HU43_9HYPH|nr:MAG: hypothetical protein A4S15_13415 [Proteobacteria bacterium SG_bin8]
MNPTNNGVLWLSNKNCALFLSRVRSQIDMALQPIVDVRNGRTMAYESLVRNTADIGFSSIVDFFQHAHDHDVLFELEVELQRKAVAAFCQANPPPGARLFINLDARLSNHMIKFCAELEKSLAKCRLEPGQLCVELSKSNQNLNGPALEDQVGALRSRGFRVAVDDYGAGSAGLRMLYQGSPDFVKIDRFFVAGMEADARKRLFVSSVVDLAHTLGVSVIGEGVETEAELKCCRESRCDLVQGYFIARPTQLYSDLNASYDHVAAASQQPIHVLHDDEIRIQIEPYEVLPASASLLQVLKLFRCHPHQTVIPIVDGNGEPRGVIREVDIKPFLHSPFGRDLLSNRAAGITLASFLRSIPAAESSSSLPHLVETYQDRLQEGVLVTQDRKYSGFLPANALVKIINNMRLSEARGANPLTKLPGNDRILEFIDNSCMQGSSERLFCYFDFDHFKPFNDVYGFGIGDRAIIMFRDIIAHEMAGTGIFYGHIGGDDFFAGAVGDACSDLAAMLTRVRETFAHSVSSLYTLSDRERGYIEAAGRDGQSACWPLMTCSVGVLRALPGSTCAGVDGVTRTLASLKKKAKTMPGGIFEVTLTRGEVTTAPQAVCSAA